MITILMATYNGERFVSEQIESLLAQTVQDFKLIVCDDRSMDKTFSLVSDYSKKYPGKIIASQNQINSGGAKDNFISMMIEYKDDYVMLCDQDDVWLPDKIEKSLNKMHEMENIYGTSTPILVHSDLKVVNKVLEIISESFLEVMFSDAKNTALSSKVIQNTNTGCTSIYNRALAELIHEGPDYMIMHDWWLMLVAAAFGKIDTIFEPTILYRQHENNDTGAKKVKSFRHVFYKAAHYKEMAVAVNQTYKQADSFLKIYYDRLSKAQREMLTAYTSIPTLTKIERLRTVYKYKTFKYGLPRKVAQIMILLKERRIAD